MKPDQKTDEIEAILINVEDFRVICPFANNPKFRTKVPPHKIGFHTTHRTHHVCNVTYIA